MELRAWKLYAAAMTLVIAAYFLTPDTGQIRMFWAVAVGWSGAAAVLVGIRLNRPPAAAAWYLFAAGVFLNSSGIAVEAFLSRGGRELPAPSLADAFYLSLYPAVVAGLFLLIVRRSARHEWAGLIDAMTISTGLGLLVWVFIIRPSIGDPQYSPLGQVVAVAYPIGDIVVLAMIVRLLVGAGRRGLSYRVLAAAVCMFLVGDMSWATINQLGLVPGPHASALLATAFLAGFSMFGVAALHPSVRTVADQGAVPESRLSPLMLLLLTTVSLIAPCILIYEVVRHQINDGIAIALGSISLFLLVITRMAGLFHEVEGQTHQLKQLTRVDELTGLPNRRAWPDELPRAIERARRSRTPLSVAMLDLDRFKEFNDEFGHPAGDELLRAVAARCAAVLRESDLLARYGGDEFILLLPDAEGQTAIEVLDRLRTVTPAGQTISIGLAWWDGIETSEELISRADDALYQAKEDGRNQTTIALRPVAFAPPDAEPDIDPDIDPDMKMDMERSAGHDDQLQLFGAG